MSEGLQAGFLPALSWNSLTAGCEMYGEPLKHKFNLCSLLIIIPICYDQGSPPPYSALTQAGHKWSPRHQTMPTTKSLRQFDRLCLKI
jgi:hypothetical protein